MGATLDLSRASNALAAKTAVKPNLSGMPRDDLRQAIVDAGVAEAAKANDEARLLFEQALSVGGIEASWHTLNGVDQEHIVNYARRHDLAILPPPHRLKKQ